MPTELIREQLINRIASELGQTTALQLTNTFVRVGVQPAAVLTLLTELADVSPKAARAAIEMLPDLEGRGAFPQIVAWLDLAVALAQSSGATTLKYLKDSPLILGLIEPERQAAVLQIALELAEQEANIALEFVRYAPGILAVLEPRSINSWLEIGVELVRVDAVVGLEYVRQIPKVVPVLPFDEIRRWLSLGMKLITPNTLGKPDYIATIEFLRTSPTILGDIDDKPVRSKVLALAALLADRLPDAGIAWLAESPRLMRLLPSMDWRVRVLEYGFLIAERDAETALSYLRRCPEVVDLIASGSNAISRFENWFGAGMETLSYGVEGARAYFAVASQKALHSIEEALSGVPLRHVARRVKLFVEGLCGAEVSIVPLADSLTNPHARVTVSADGRTIALPALLRRYPTVEENERLYLVMAAHEAGHLEFGTYRLKLEALSDLILAVRKRYGRMDQPMPDTLASLFGFYPHPRLMHDLWMVLEDARVEFLLGVEYPGLRQDLAQLAAEAVAQRDPAQGLTAKELIVDCLLRLTTGGFEQSIPSGVKEEVAILWDLCQPILSLSATAEEAVQCADRLYVRMDELLAPRAEMLKAEEFTPDTQDVGVGPSSLVATGEYRPVNNWVHRGAMNPEFIPRDLENCSDENNGLHRTASHGGGSSERPRAGVGRSLPPVAEELLSLDVTQPSLETQAGSGPRAVFYPEWDYAIRDFRMQWCRVLERAVEIGSDDFVSSVLRRHHSAIRLLRRFFENLRPPAFRRVPGQVDGEELDIEAVVSRAADLQAGLDGGDRIYIRRERRQRDVAVGFLVDVSGSTGKQLESGRRVIDVEKEGLVLICEALEAVGDQYALFAYSGEGRASVDFLTIKDFDERLGSSTAHRLGSLAPLRQNRDGAAIRHATVKLLAREATTRLLILLSDGRPLDGEYKDEYSLEDTKVALKEARRRGIHPFCVTIDREADSYLRRMYGDVQYMVIDRVESLPARLPRLYRQLTR